MISDTLERAYHEYSDESHTDPLLENKDIAETYVVSDIIENDLDLI